MGDASPRPQLRLHRVIRLAPRQPDLDGKLDAFGAGEPTEGHHAAATLTIPRVDQQRLSGEEIRAWQPGHIYVVDFWATWCPPCIKGLRHLQELHQELADQNVHIVAAAIWPNPGSEPPEKLLDSTAHRFVVDTSGTPVVGRLNLPLVS